MFNDVDGVAEWAQGEMLALKYALDKPNSDFSQTQPLFQFCI